MNQEEAIEYLKRKIEDCNHIIEASSYIGNKKAYAKERTKYKEILKLIENQQSELDKKDITIIETKEANRQLSIELQKKDKMIDEMTEEFRTKTLMYSDMSKEEIKQYFERKAKNGN